jgi:hypothetical protein
MYTTDKITRQMLAHGRRPGQLPHQGFRAPQGLGVDRVALAAPAPGGPVRPVHLEDGHVLAA